MFRPEPSVRLERYFQSPYDNAIATARTCYSSKVVTPEEVAKSEKTRNRRDAIAQSIYQAGHHTVFQHATFQFVLERVSRQFVWSFLHSHPFYNSEQVSQRYVEVKPDNFAVPTFSNMGEELYRQAAAALMEAYRRLIDLVEPTVSRESRRIFPYRKHEQDRWRKVIHKKQMEVARYVLPVATHTFLYHTISGITLHRYHRLCNLFDTTEEQRKVVRAMVEEVNRVDPGFMKLAEDPIPLEETPEFEIFRDLESSLTRPGRAEFVREFDAELNGRTSGLVDYKVNGERSLAQAVRSVLGVPRDRMSDERAIELVMNPKLNRYLSDTLNLTTLSKLSRAMVHPHFTFRKKLSHTADSQDQRHRMVPGSRPILARHFLPDRPDYVVPAVIARTPEALDFYKSVMEDLWNRMARLLEMGEREEHVLYLLPNAFPIRFEESGDLLSFHHKWTQRLCYTAQEEIWNASRDEVLQVKEVCPLIARHLLPPCGLRQEAGRKPFCPEGDRFCGVLVWRLPIERYDRLI
jgi:thymidylate synthase ThyX